MGMTPLVEGSVEVDQAPAGSETVTVSSTGIGLDPPDLATDALVQVQAQPVRMRPDGTDPTATSGFAFAAGDMFELNGMATIRAARFIREGGVDATLFVAYFVRRRVLMAPSAWPGDQP